MRKVLKWIGYILGGLVGIVLITLGVAYAKTSSRMNRTYPTEVTAVPILTDSMSLERGHHLVIAVGKCVACHGDNLAGKMVADDPAFGTIWSSNLTRGKGGVGSTYEDADYVRAIRYGIRKNGTPLTFMPSEAFTHFSDADLGSIIAYVKSVPPVDQQVVPLRIGPIGRVVATLNASFPLAPAEQIDRNADRSPVPIGVTKEYGDYLLKTGGCKSCHTPTLSGGQKIEGVMSANLTPTGIGKWTEEDFFKALRMGVRPDGRILSAAMPWPYTKNLTDDEIRAMWMYLRTLPPRATGE
ncbi:MAG TPA: c-type cytochrome [Gemmatimonadaceae bacterium]|nr:c-type cytochrome [Gemmatimonadaceae bacterium]